MALRRLAEQQPEAFAFSDENLAWAAAEIAKYPEGRQASAVIALLWRAQDQDGWVSEPAVQTVAEMLDMPRIRVLEIATFYTMFHLAPVGRTAHILVCGTTPCWLMGAERIREVCQRRIHAREHLVSADGAFSWEEAECLGACVNAPLVQIGADTFEDLTPASFELLLDDLAAGRRPQPGPQVERRFAAPAGGLTTLMEAVGDEVATAPVAGAEAGRPQALAAPRAGGADDLKLISGVGPKIEDILNALGVFHYNQIGAWSEATVGWVDEHLKFKGRIGRENWIDQARTLASGGETEFSRTAGGEAVDED